MKRVMIATAMICALSAVPASAETYRTYRCSNNTALRVIFDEERNAATVVPFGRPTIRLTRTQGDGSNFHYARNSTHELSGNREEVQWRVRSNAWTCRRVGS